MLLAQMVNALFLDNFVFSCLAYVRYLSYNIKQEGIYMPALSMFFGIIIYMYKEVGGLHNVPHIHAEYQDDEAVISLDGDVIGGTLPRKKLRLVLAWVIIHHDELLADWSLLSRGQAPFKIAPLQ